DGFQNPLSPFWCGLSGAPGCVTWELILDGYSESSYSATPRFAAARLPWFRHFIIKITLNGRNQT
ncbi:hypothetical protein ACW3RH_004279, partial [Shigella flexneri]